MKDALLQKEKTHVSNVLDSFSFVAVCIFEDVTGLFSCITLGGRITTPQRLISFCFLLLRAGICGVRQKPSVAA